MPCGDRQTRHRADRRQRLTAKTQRANVQKIVAIELRCCVALDRQCEIALRHARAVIGDADAPSPAAIRRNVDMRRACIDGVLDELLHNAGRPLDDLAGGNPVDNGFWQLTNGHGQYLAIQGVNRKMQAAWKAYFERLSRFFIVRMNQVSCRRDQAADREIDMSTQTILWIISGVMLAISALCLVGVVRSFILSRAARSWPVVMGKILVSELVSETSIETDNDNSTSREVTMYGVNLKYEYSVGGQKMESDRITWVDGIKVNSQSPARKILDAYPVGKMVQVYYRPDDPAFAMLEPHKLGSVYFLLLFGLAFGGFGGFLLWVAPHAR